MKRGKVLDALCRSLLEQAASPVSIRTPDGRYLFCNAEFVRRFGIDAGRLGAVSDATIFPLAAAAAIGTAVAAAVATGSTQDLLLDLPAAGADQRLHLSCLPLRDADGQLFAIGSIFTVPAAVDPGSAGIAEALASAERSNQELRQALSDMERLATTDRLTGTWNRRRFEDTAVIEMARSERYGNQVSLLLLDLDHFKEVNDRHGHAVGDRVLSEFAALLGAAIRKSDSLARWGGEEFLVLARNTRLPEARRLAEKLRLRIASGSFSGIERITTSIGVAEYQRGEGLEGWLLRADRALYAAKSGGRNQVVADNASAFADASPRTARSSMQLVWREAYRIGHQLIDVQHERLFGLANRLLDDIANGALRSDVLETIALLLEETVAHFSDEEAIHRESGFAEAGGHADEHQRLLGKARRLSQQVEKGLLSPYDMFEFLAYEVVAQHMLGADRRFVAHLKTSQH